MTAAVYRIALERISTGERAKSMVTRQESEDAARAYAEAAIRQSTEPNDLRVATVTHLSSTTTIAGIGTATATAEVVRQYDADFLQWTEQQAALLRRMAAGEPVNAEPDWLNLAEEIESVGASEKREVRSRLALILQHLLKWRYQPDLRSRSWENTLFVQRRDLLALFEDSPSLRPFAASERVLSAAFANGRQAAERETGLLNITDVCPWPFEDVISQDFLPD